jgi:hypothetical protein
MCFLNGQSQDGKAKSSYPGIEPEFLKVLRVQNENDGQWKQICTCTA